MTEHVSDTEIEDFALGELPAARLPGFEAHVSICDQCAGRLAREARLELVLAEAAATAPAERRARRALLTRRTAGAALATFALAAAVLLLVLRGAGEQQPAAPAIPELVCADGPGQTGCVQRAQRHGLFVQYPDWAGPGPFGPRDPSAGPSVAPFPVARPRP
ncbi:MAG TPA: hypothetical protein VKB80_21285 [Kofleriaceae bacterium]|nr:hypothetical protein [Kofleriaceae bacterium]